jgi:putative ABC transport system permease protein
LKKVLEIAWRSVWRNKGRSLIIVLAMTIGIANILFVMSFSWGMSQFRIRESIQREISHIQIHDSLFLESFDVTKSVNAPEKIKEILSQNPAVKAYAERIKTLGFMETTHGGAGIMLLAVDTAQESKVTELKSKVIEGAYFGRTKSIPILIGSKLAENLELKVKSKATIRIQNGNSSLALGVKVKGIYESANSRLDGMNVYMSLSDLEGLVDINYPNEIAVLLKSNDDEAMYALQEDLQVHEQNAVDTWRETEPELALAIESFNLAMTILVLIFFLAVALGIVNTMLMAILERVREIGMLMAIGMNRLKIFMMFMLETLFLSLVGAPLGLLLGYILISVAGHYGVDLSLFGEGLSDLGFSSMVYPELEASKYLLLTAEIFLIALVASIIPARRALKLNPATAVRKL